MNVQNLRNTEYKDLFLVLICMFIGCFVGYYLNVSLTAVKTFHSHLEGLPLIRTSQLSDQVEAKRNQTCNVMERYVNKA